MMLAEFPSPSLTPLATTVQEEEEQQADLMELLRDLPAEFQRIVLQRELWWAQIDVCNAIAASPMTVVPAGRAVGKSFLLAGIVLWWLYTRPHSLVITTGPDHRQVVSVLWKEIKRAKLTSLFPLKCDLVSKGYGSPQRWDVLEGEDWGALGFAAKSSEGFSGQHAGDMLVIVDEASGVEQAIWTSILGAAATRIVVVGNPLRHDCYFRELHDLASKPGSTIKSITISTLDCPHAELEQSPVGMASASFLRQMREIHGEHSPWWKSNILGQFPGQESVRFIPTAWLDACTNESTPHDELWRDLPCGVPCIGVDLGGGVGADRSVVVVRDRKQILEIFASEWHGVLDDARHRIEPVVLEMVRKWSVPSGRVIYDQSGLGRSFGSYLSRSARELRDAWLHSRIDQPPAREEDGPQLCDSALGYFGSGRGGKLYLNRRTANAYALKRRLDPHRDGYVPLYAGGAAHWPDLRRELSELRTPTQEFDDGELKMRLENKEDLAARLHRSPDVLDALLMTFTFSD